MGCCWAEEQLVHEKRLKQGQGEERGKAHEACRHPKRGCYAWGEVKWEFISRQHPAEWSNHPLPCSSMQQLSKMSPTLCCELHHRVVSHGILKMSLYHFKSHVQCLFFVLRECLLQSDWKWCFCRVIQHMCLTVKCREIIYSSQDALGWVSTIIITVDKKKKQNCLKWSGFAMNSCLFLKVEQLDSLHCQISQIMPSASGIKPLRLQNLEKQIRSSMGSSQKWLWRLPETPRNWRWTSRPSWSHSPLFRAGNPILFPLGQLLTPCECGVFLTHSEFKVLGLVCVFVCYHLWSFKNMSMCNLTRGLEKIKAHFYEPLHTSFAFVGVEPLA